MRQTKATVEIEAPRNWERRIGLEAETCLTTPVGEEVEVHVLGTIAEPVEQPPYAVTDHFQPTPKI
jgi:hypothetical protein